MDNNIRNDEYTTQTAGMNENGEVKIANEVIAVVAGLAAAEVEGIATMGGSMTKGIGDRIGIKAYTKGIKLEIDSEGVKVDISLIIKYGYSIPKVTHAVQDRVKTAIENMTGISVEQVNIHVVGINTIK